VIDRVTGTILEVQPEVVVLDLNGWGVRVEVCPTTSEAIGRPGDRVTLLTHLLVSTNDPTPRLLGFPSPSARELFHLLLGVAGLGATRALRLLGAQPDPADVATAIARGDDRAIKVKGVGPKIAKRVVSELCDKVGPLAAVSASGSRPRPAAASAPRPGTPEDDALRALRQLEFDPDEARRLLGEVRPGLPSEVTADELVRAVLLRA